MFQQVVTNLLGGVTPAQIQVPASTEGREQPSSKLKYNAFYNNIGFHLDVKAQNEAQGIKDTPSPSLPATKKKSDCCS